MCRIRNEVRSFKLASGRGDEYGFMFTADYAVAVARAAASPPTPGQTTHSRAGSRAGSASRRPPAATAAEVAEWFLASVIPRCCEVLLQLADQLSLSSRCSSGSLSMPAGRSVIPLIEQIAVRLTRHLKQ